MLAYYFVLRSVCSTKPHLLRYRTRCQHCGIFFLTDPRNAGRRDLRCPFGCRETHSKQSSTQRSVAFYRTEVGKQKKKLQNDKRKRSAKSASEEDSQSEEEEEQPEEERPEQETDGAVFDAGMVSYVQMVTSLIEGRRVSRVEILQMLARSLRQHSMARRTRTEYHVQYLNEKPP